MVCHPGREVPEHLLEPHRQLDVGQGVAAQADERVVVADVAALQDLGVEAAHNVERRAHRVVSHRRVAHRGAVRALRSGASGDRDAIRLAVRQARQLGVLEHHHAGRWQAEALLREVAHRLRGCAVRDRDHQPLVVAGTQRGDARGCEHAFDLLEVDAQAEELHEPALAPDDLVQPVGGAPRDVAGAQLVDVAAPGEVGRTRRVAEHDVGAAIDELAFVRLASVRLVSAGADRCAVAIVVDRHECERPAGDGHADRARVGPGEVRRQVRHARGRLGLPVHDEQVPPLATAELGVTANPLGFEAPTGLCHVAQRGQRHRLEADAIEQVERVGHAREARDAEGAGVVPEAPVDDRQRRQHERGALQQVTVEHREAVAVVHGQRGDRAIALGDRQVLRDRLGVGLEVAVREPHHLRRAGRARGRQQHRELGVQLVGGLGVAVLRVPRAVDAPHDDVGVVGADEIGQVLFVVSRHEHRDVAAPERSEVADDGRQVVGARDHHELATAAVGGGHGLDPLRELGVGQREVSTEHGDPIAVALEPVDERHRGHRARGGFVEHRGTIFGLPNRSRTGTCSTGGRCATGVTVTAPSEPQNDDRPGHAWPVVTVGRKGVEPLTPCASCKCSNQLS